MKKLSVCCEGWGERWLLGTLADDGVRLSGPVADARPDGWGLRLMDQLFRKQGRNPASVSPLDRLVFIHGRAIGALNVEPAQKTDLPAEDVQWLALAQQARVVIADKDSDALRRLAVLGGSPHGARPKVLVHHHPVDGFMRTVPFEGSEAWMVKFQAQDEHEAVCAIEVLYAELAGAFGLDMPTTRHFDLNQQLAGFGIRRYDVEDGMRVPVHTLAGLMHANLRLPSAVDDLTFLRAARFITRSPVEVDKACERAVFSLWRAAQHGTRAFAEPGQARWRRCRFRASSDGPGMGRGAKLCRAREASCDSARKRQDPACGHRSEPATHRLSAECTARACRHLFAPLPHKTLRCREGSSG